MTNTSDVYLAITAIDAWKIIYSMGMQVESMECLEDELYVVASNDTGSSMVLQCDEVACSEADMNSTGALLIGINQPLNVVCLFQMGSEPFIQCYSSGKLQSTLMLSTWNDILQVYWFVVYNESTFFVGSGSSIFMINIDVRGDLQVTCAGNYH